MDNNTNINLSLSNEKTSNEEKKKDNLFDDIVNNNTNSLLVISILSHIFLNSLSKSKV